MQLCWIRKHQIKIRSLIRQFDQAASEILGSAWQLSEPDFTTQTIKEQAAKRAIDQTNPTIQGWVVCWQKPGS